MPPLPAYHLILLLLLLVHAASASAAGFTCTKPSTCQCAVIGYVVPKTITYEELISQFSPTTLHDFVAFNQLPSNTATKQVIPAKTTLTIPFRCRCTGNGVGQSVLYVAQNKFDDGLVTYEPEIVSANNIADDAAKRKLWIPLPCSCDKVNGADVTHFAYIVRSGDSVLEIAAKYCVLEFALLEINKITNHTSLHQGQVLDIPLQGMVGGELWPRVHYISGFRKRRLGRFNPTDGEQAVRVAEEAAVAAKAAAEYSVKVVKGVLIIIIFSFVCFTFHYWRSACESLSSCTNGVIQFDYGDLARATHRFSNESKIGEGHYGAVYKATINGHEMAVKKFKAEGETKELHRELQTVSNTKHTNLVSLKGWCGRVRLIDGKSRWKRKIKVELLLVFEWIPNGNLADHLHKREQVLPWEKRCTMPPRKRKAVGGDHGEVPSKKPKCPPSRNRASPTMLLTACKDMPDERKDAIDVMKFRSLRGIKCDHLFSYLSEWLAGLYDPDSREVVVPGHGRIPVDEESVHRVMGVHRGGEDVPYNLPTEPDYELGH